MKPPLLMLAPMEGLTHAGFRSLLCDIGGVDTVATEFIRITGANQSVQPFARPSSVPLQIQLMASDVATLRGSISHLKKTGVLFESDWIDLNVGCPSKRVNAHGAGAALLKEPEKIVEMLCAMRSVHPEGKLSLKTRLGYQNGEAFPELVSLLNTTPIDLLTIHARARCSSYDDPIELDPLRYAAKELSIPVIGNGDIFQPEDALQMIQSTGVSGVMCGRGAVTNPYLFRDIRALLTDGAVEYDPRERRQKLLGFAGSLLNWQRENERSSGKKRNRLGPFKEFAVWFSRNELIGREFFARVKRMTSYEEAELLLQDFSTSDLTEIASVA